MNEQTKHIIDWAAVGATVTTIAGWLPDIAAFMAIVWYLVRFYDRWKKGKSTED